MKYKVKRAEAQYSKKDSTAQLSTPDRAFYIEVKLLDKGEFVFTMHHAGKSYHREFSPAVNWDD